MSDLRSRLKSIINNTNAHEVQDVLKEPPRRERMSHDLEQNGNYIEEIKAKIRNFKEDRRDSTSNLEEILNFDVSREGLKKYKRPDNEGFNFEKNSHDNPIKSDITTTKEQNRPVKSFLKGEEDIKTNQCPEQHGKFEIQPQTTRNNFLANRKTISISCNGKQTYNFIKLPLKNECNDENISSRRSNQPIKLNNSFRTLDHTSSQGQSFFEKNKIKTQIGDFVKQLEQERSSSKGQSKSVRHHSHSSTPLGEAKPSISLKDFEKKISNNQSTLKLEWTRKESSSVNQKNKLNLKYSLDEIRNFRSELIQLTQDQINRLDKEYVKEMRSLAEVISQLFQ